MPSPFPGMDPYLENAKLWPSFQHQLVGCLYQILIPAMVDRYRARVGQRQYISGQALPEEHHEEFIEIRQRSDGRLISLLDIVSPANKTTDAGRNAYLDTRREGRAQGSNLVEIDLILQGPPLLEYSRNGLPDWDYSVTVTRASQPDRFEIYTSTLQKRLPRFRLPLAADDRDTVLDLHAACGRAYDQGNFASQIDYRREPAVPLNEENRRWVRQLLHLPEPAPEPTHEEIARAAYFIWQEEGCPHGRDKEHWQLAVERLQIGVIKR